MSHGLTVRSAISAGLITGAVMIYLVAVGIASAFAEREVVTGYLTLGHLMLALPPLAIGYIVASRPGCRRPSDYAMPWLPASPPGPLRGGIPRSGRALAGHQDSPQSRLVVAPWTSSASAISGWSRRPAPSSTLASQPGWRSSLAWCRIAPSSRAALRSWEEPAAVLLMGHGRAVPATSRSAVRPYRRRHQFFYRAHGLGTVSALLIPAVGSVLGVTWPGCGRTARSRLAVVDPGNSAGCCAGPDPGRNRLPVHAPLDHGVVPDPGAGACGLLRPAGARA